MDIQVFMDNIRHLREEGLRAKLSEMPSIIGFSQSTWSNYENGVSNPKFQDLEKICNYFGITEYDLFNTDITSMSSNELESEIFEKYIFTRPVISNPATDKHSTIFLDYLSKKNNAISNNIYKSSESLEKMSFSPSKKQKHPQNDIKSGNSASESEEKHTHKRTPTRTPTLQNANVLKNNDTTNLQETMSFYGTKTPQIITLDSVGRDNIVFVPVRAQAGYLMGYGDKEYIETLPAFSMPGISHGTYRMFEVNGISMAPTLGSGDKVIAEWVQNPIEMRDNRVYIVIHKEGVAIKRVINRLQQRGKIYLASDTIHHRSEFPTIEVDQEDIREIWYVKLKISADLSEPTEIFKKMADFDINLTAVMAKLGIPKL